MDKTSVTLKSKFFLQDSIAFVFIIGIIVFVVKIFKFNALVAFIFMITELILFNYRRKIYLSNLENIINKDKLTGLYNYNYFNKKLNSYLMKKKLNCKALSVMFVDINSFKIYNDINGHLSGDIVLKEISKILNSVVRKNDIVTRYSGEEFALIFKNTTKEEALILSEEIKNKFNEKRFVSKIFENEKLLTLSIGITEFPRYAKNYLEIIKSCDDDLNRDKILSKASGENYSNILQSIENELKNDKEVITVIKTLISVINGKDKYTYGHTERVVNYAKLMADELRLSKENKRKLIYGAYIHDVGKISIGKEILIKRMPLDNCEWEEIKAHTKYGYDIISNIKSLKDMTDMVLYHHERYDGTGYPKGLKGEKIPYLARVLVVIDSFDAMTTSRPYNIKKSYKEGINELKRCSGTQFDPKVVEVFIRIIENEVLNTEDKVV